MFVSSGPSSPPAACSVVPRISSGDFVMMFTMPSKALKRYTADAAPFSTSIRLFQSRRPVGASKRQFGIGQDIWSVLAWLDCLAARQS